MNLACGSVWKDRPLSWDLSFSVLSPRPVPWLQEDSGPGKRAPRSLKGQTGWEPGLGSLTGAREGVGPSLLLLGTVSLEHSALVSEHILEGPVHTCGRSHWETPGLPTHGVDICVQELLSESWVPRERRHSRPLLPGPAHGLQCRYCSGLHSEPR